MAMIENSDKLTKKVRSVFGKVRFRGRVGMDAGTKVFSSVGAARVLPC